MKRVLYQAAVDKIDQIINWIAGGLVAVGVCFLTYSIFVRFAFRKTYDWGVEVLVGIVITGVLLGGASIVRSDGHTSVNVVTGRLSGRRLLLWKLVLAVVSAAAFSFLAVSGFIVLFHIIDTGTVTRSSLQTAEWVYYLPLPITMLGCALFALEKITQLTRAYLRSAPDKNKEEDLSV